LIQKDNHTQSFIEKDKEADPASGHKIQ